VLDDYGAMKKAAYARKIQNRRDRKPNQSADQSASADAADSAMVEEPEPAQDSEQAVSVDDAAADNSADKDEGARPERTRPTHADPLVDACLQMGMDIYEQHSDVPENLHKKVRKSVFPPTEAEADWMHLGNNYLW
jgi:hypothetical protein